MGIAMGLKRDSKRNRETSGGGRKVGGEGRQMEG